MRPVNNKRISFKLKSYHLVEKGAKAEDSPQSSPEIAKEEEPCPASPQSEFNKHSVSVSFTESSNLSSPQSYTTSSSSSSSSASVVLVSPNNTSNSTTPTKNLSTPLPNTGSSPRGVLHATLMKSRNKATPANGYSQALDGLDVAGLSPWRENEEQSKAISSKGVVLAHSAERAKKDNKKFKKKKEKEKEKEKEKDKDKDKDKDKEKQKKKKGHKRGASESGDQGVVIVPTSSAWKRTAHIGKDEAENLTSIENLLGLLTEPTSSDKPHPPLSQTKTKPPQSSLGWAAGSATAAAVAAHYPRKILFDDSSFNTSSSSMVAAGDLITVGSFQRRNNSDSGSGASEGRSGIGGSGQSSGASFTSVSSHGSLDSENSFTEDYPKIDPLSEKEMEDLINKLDNDRKGRAQRVEQIIIEWENYHKYYGNNNNLMELPSPHVSFNEKMNVSSLSSNSEKSGTNKSKEIESITNVNENNINNTNNNIDKNDSEFGNTEKMLMIKQEELKRLQEEVKILQAKQEMMSQLKCNNNH